MVGLVRSDTAELLFQYSIGGRRETDKLGDVTNPREFV
jgi:hypothetical protein